MDFLQHTVAIQTHSHHWLMFLLPSLGGRKIEASQSAAVTCDHRRSSGPWSHDPRAAVLSGGGWRGHTDSQSIDTSRRRCFSANNIFCQGCFAATLLSGKPLSLHWQTLPSLQDFTFFSAPLLCRRVCTWKVSYLWKTRTFVSPFLYFPYISWQWSLNKSSAWNPCLRARLHTQTPEK